MVKYKLEHNRPECIGCGACVAIAPDDWKMNDDGKADMIGCTKRDDGWEEKEISEDKKELSQEVAECCPVNAIHLTDKETGEKLV